MNIADNNFNFQSLSISRIQQYFFILLTFAFFVDDFVFSPNIIHTLVCSISLLRAPVASA